MLQRVFDSTPQGIALGIGLDRWNRACNSPGISQRTAFSFGEQSKCRINAVRVSLRTHTGILSCKQHVDMEALKWNRLPAAVLPPPHKAAEASEFATTSRIRDLKESVVSLGGGL